jgi:hypothetical protein
MLLHQHDEYPQFGQLCPGIANKQIRPIGKNRIQHTTPKAENPDSTKLPC